MHPADDIPPAPSSLSPRHRLCLLTLLALGFVLSFLWWKLNPNREALLSVFPEWDFRGYVIYDGYGNYAAVLRDYFARPSQETLASLAAFTDGYIHTIRPLYPVLVALVALVLGDILLSALVVTVGSVALCLWAFHLLAVRMARGDGVMVFHLHLLFASHVAVIGMLARPMADPLSLALLLLSMEAFLRALEGGGGRRWLVLVAVFVLAVLAKTVSIILLAAMGLALLRPEAAFWRTHWAKVLGGGLMLGLVAGGLIATIRALPATSATWEFLVAFFRGVTQFPTDGGSLWLFGKAAVLFLALALQAHPLFVLANPWWGRARREGEDLLALAMRLHLWWVLIYMAQRFVFYGFNLDYSRARYGIPLVASILLLSYPGMRRLMGERRTAIAVWVLVVLNVAVFGGTLLRAI